MILKRMFFLREQSMTKKSMTFQNAVSPHMGRGERVTRLHQQIAACGIETLEQGSLHESGQDCTGKLPRAALKRVVERDGSLGAIAPANCRVR